MNKAFVKEADDADDDDEAPGLPPLPAGTRNYLTPQGWRRLREELMTLLDVGAPEDGRGRLLGGQERRPLARTATTCTARSGCARSTAASAS